MSAFPKCSTCLDKGWYWQKEKSHDNRIALTVLAGLYVWNG